MRRWVSRIKLFLILLRYKEYDRRVIRGVSIISLWGLKKTILVDDKIIIPLRFRRDDEEQQILMLLKEFRMAKSFRIVRKL